MLPRASVAAMLGAFLTFAQSGLSNGRFPTARMLAVGPGARADVLALATTFGLVLSRDGGARWSWLCEQALGYASQSDPSVVVARDGTVVVATEGGVFRLAEGGQCAPVMATQVLSAPFYDLAVDPSGDTLAAIGGGLVSGYFVGLSADRGDRWTRGYAQADLFPSNVDVAPGHPQRLYLSGVLQGGRPILLRSDDGGQTFPASTNTFQGGFDAWVTLVDPANQDHLFVRSHLAQGSDIGTLLLESTDAGATLRIVGRTAAAMTGVARAPDGTLWIAGTGSTDGVQRSTDGGRTWTRLAGANFLPLCLRFQAGLLFACADENLPPYASLFVSSDNGESFRPLLRFRELPSPACECPRSSAVGSSCDATWAQLQLSFGDAGGAGAMTCAEASVGADASTDVGSEASESGNDAGLLADAPGTSELSPPARGCSCSAAGRGAPQERGERRCLGGAALVLALAALERSASRRRQEVAR